VPSHAKTRLSTSDLMALAKKLTWPSIGCNSKTLLDSVLLDISLHSIAIFMYCTSRFE